MKKGKRIVTIIVCAITIISTIAISCLAYPSFDGDESIWQAEMTSKATIHRIIGQAERTEQNQYWAVLDGERHITTKDTIFINENLKSKLVATPQLIQQTLFIKNEINNEIIEDYETIEISDIGVTYYPYSNMLNTDPEDNIHQFTKELSIEWNNVIIDTSTISYTDKNRVKTSANAPCIIFKWSTDKSLSELENYLNNYLKIGGIIERKEEIITSSSHEELQNGGYEIEEKYETIDNYIQFDEYVYGTFTKNNERYVKLYFLPNRATYESIKTKITREGAERTRLIKIKNLSIRLIAPPIIRDYVWSIIGEEITLGDQYETEQQLRTKEEQYNAQFKNMKNGVNRDTKNVTKVTQTIDTGGRFVNWITRTVENFFNMEIAQGIQLGDIFNIIIVFAIFIIILKIFAGG